MATALLQGCCCCCCFWRAQLSPCSPALAKHGAQSLTGCCAAQEDSTTKRLTTLEDMLTSSVAYLRAKLALDGAFNAPSISVDAPTAEAAAQGEDSSQQGQAEAFQADEAATNIEESKDVQQEGAPDRPEEGSGAGA